MTNLPDIRQHVARRVRITRMYFRLSLEQSAAFLGMPVWLLDYKENGLLHFSYQEFVDLERLYNTPWRVFFKDFDSEGSSSGQKTGAAFEAPERLDVIVNYLKPGVEELSNENEGLSDGTSYPMDTDFDLAVAVHDARDAYAGARRWA